MFQRLDFFDWSADKAEKVKFLLDKEGLLEDYEIIVEVDGVAHGYLDFLNVASEDVQWLADHWTYH